MMKQENKLQQNSGSRLLLYLLIKKEVRGVIKFVKGDNKKHSTTNERLSQGQRSATF